MLSRPGKLFRSTKISPAPGEERARIASASLLLMDEHRIMLHDDEKNSKEIKNDGETREGRTLTKIQLESIGSNDAIMVSFMLGIGHFFKRMSNRFHNFKEKI